MSTKSSAATASLARTRQENLSAIKGRSRVRRTEIGAYVEIEYKGPDIPPEERKKVFERFYRLTTWDGPDGSGLGLAIVRALADRLGGAVTLASDESRSGLAARVNFRVA